MFNAFRRILNLAPCGRYTLYLPVYPATVGGFGFVYYELLFFAMHYLNIFFTFYSSVVSGIDSLVASKIAPSFLNHGSLWG